MIEDLDTLPDGWSVATLPQLIGPSGVFSDGDWVESKDQDPDGAVRLTQLADVGVGKFLDRSSRYLTASSAEILRCTFLEPDDLLIARMPEPLGRACLFPGATRPCVTVVDVCITRVDPANVDPRWLMWWLNTPQIHARIEALQSGTTRKRISRGNLATIQFPIPPLAEQRRIVAEIETQFARLDAAEAALARAQANLQVHREATLRELLLGVRLSLPGTEFEACGDWEWTTLGDIAAVKGGLAKGNARRAGLALRSVPYLRVANVQRGWLDLREIKCIDATEAEVAALRLLDGDVLFNEGGDRDKLGRGWVWENQLAEVIHQNHVFRARLKPDTLLPKYLSLYANTFGQGYFMSTGKQTTNLASISLSNLKKLPLPLPDITTQLAILDAVDIYTTGQEQLDSAVTANRARAAALRQSILQRAFAGQLVAQDPDDEPASVLLERIEAERAAATPAQRTRAVGRPCAAPPDTEVQRGLL